MIESPHAYTRFLCPQRDDTPPYGTFGTASVPRRLSAGILPAEEIRRRINARGGRVVGATNLLFPAPPARIHKQAYQRGPFSYQQNSIYRPIANSTFYTAYPRYQNHW